MGTPERLASGRRQSAAPSACRRALVVARGPRACSTSGQAGGRGHLSLCVPVLGEPAAWHGRWLDAAAAANHSPPSSRKALTASPPPTPPTLLPRPPAGPLSRPPPSTGDRALCSLWATSLVRGYSCAARAVVLRAKKLLSASVWRRLATPSGIADRVRRHSVLVQLLCPNDASVGRPSPTSQHGHIYKPRVSAPTTCPRVYDSYRLSRCSLQDDACSREPVSAFLKFAL